MYYIVFILALFSAVGFFNYHGMLSDQMQRAIFYAVSCMSLLLAVTERRVRLSEIEYPRYAYWTVIGSLFISILMVTVYHGQGLSQSLITTLPFIFSYLYLYVLLKFQLSEQQIIRVFMVGCLLSVPVYFCNLLSFPQVVFGVENAEGADFTRGMLRVYVVFIEIFVLLFFYAIYKWKHSHKKIWLAWIALCVIMITLSLIRQIIAVSFIFGIIYMLQGVPLRKKLVTLAVVVVLGVVVIPRISIFQAMIELSNTQAEQNEENEDIRIRAWRYYTYENQDGVETVLFGNGVPALGISPYGIIFEQDAQESKCYFADVGWAGFFYLFGLFGTLALLALLCRGMMSAYRRGRIYLSFWLAFIIVTAVASGSIVYYYQTVVIMAGLYLAYIPDEENGSHNTELQQC